MISGIEFIEASNVLICANATYRVRTNYMTTETKVYQYRTGPNGSWVDELEEEYDESRPIGRRLKWKTLESHWIQNRDMSRFLPPKEFGDWDERKFILALTFWGEGHKRGYDEGETEGYRRGRALEKRLQDG